MLTIMFIKTLIFVTSCMCKERAVILLQNLLPKFLRKPSNMQESNQIIENKVHYMVTKYYKLVLQCILINTHV